MAIDRLVKITIVDRKFAGNRLISRLHDLGTVEIIEMRDAHRDAPEHALKAEPDHHRGVEDPLHKINFMLGLLHQFAPEKKSFIAGLAPVPLLVDPAELQDAVQHFPLDVQFQRAHELDESYRHHERAITQLEQELAQLRPFAAIDVPLNKLHSLERMRARLVEVPKKVEEESVRRLAELPSLSLERLPGNGPARFWLAYLPADEAALLDLLKELHLQEVALPRIEGNVADRMRKLEDDLSLTREAQRQTVDALRKLGEHRRALQVLKAHWENELRKQQVHGQLMSGQWLSVLSGYVRERDLPGVQTLLQKEFETASLTVEAPGPDDTVPVSITHNRFVKPISLLVTMYGLPRYNSFDPSPFLMFSFFLFFGICFSDVGYGFLLCCASAYLAYRAREYAHLRSFAHLFLYGGLSTMIFGAMLGSWFGDLFLPKYLGEDNLLLKLQQTFVLFEPMNKPVVALILALSIGMLNQFYGISLKMYDAARIGDWTTAIFDGLLWLIMLPGMVILISTLFVKVPPAVLVLATTLVVVGGTGLILTQGRCEKTLAGKATVGVISLYGIFGSYGCTAFIGDTLSYCRLLALGSTTGIVAMSINLIGDMIRGVPYVGWLLFALLLIFGHAFNFAISVLGAFIHSARPCGRLHS